MKLFILLALALSLTACGKLSDTITTGIDGYALRCIDGTQYILMSSDRGLAITPHVDINGKPKGCVNEPK